MSAVLSSSPTMPAATTDAAFEPCPITPVVEIVFSRWTTPILWALHNLGPRRFSELRELLGSVTPKVLTQRLRQLERDGMVTRVYYQEMPPRVEYSITELGLSLVPSFMMLASWSAENLESVSLARQSYDASGRPRPA